ncbi:MAG: hypothetical protein J6L47_02795 [Alphaproteobacteria bacterium]|nr:hypothetical protein [Alphaproteobacteria bacterium]
MPNLNVGLGLAMVISSSAQAIVSCLSLESCSVSLFDGACCCPTGSTGTTYSCPSGWTINSSKTSCDRSSETGSDSTGSYTLTYTSCSPETSTYDCYRTTPASSTTTSCYCQTTQN